MPAYVRWKEAKFRWYGERIARDTRALMVDRLNTAGRYLVAKVQANLGVKGPPHSKEGEFPRELTGDLRGSIFYRVNQRALTVTVGTNSRYGWFLEHGTRGGKVIHARPGKVFSWVDQKTGERVYAKSVTLGAIKGRSFLRRTMHEERAAVKELLAGDPKLGVRRVQFGRSMAA